MSSKAKKKAASAPVRECAYCGTQEGDDDTKLLTCARCGLVAYCSAPCQIQHWKRKPGGHKEFCLTPEERRPAELKTESRPAEGASFSRTEDTRDAGDECVICFDVLASSASCILPCSHIFHAACVDRLRSLGIDKACPMCREALPPGADQLFEEACRLYMPVEQRIERRGGSWDSMSRKEKSDLAKAASCD